MTQTTTVPVHFIRDATDWAVISATIGAALLTFLALVVAAWGLWYAARELKEQGRAQGRARTYQYMDKLFSLDLMECRLQANQQLEEVEKAGTSHADRLAAWEALKSTEEGRLRRAKTLYYLNLFEEIGALWRDSLLDKAIVRRVIGPWSDAAWEKAEPLIGARRDQQGNDSLYEDWEDMRGDLAKPALTPKGSSTASKARRLALPAVVVAVGIAAASLGGAAIASGSIKVCAAAVIVGGLGLAGSVASRTASGPAKDGKE